MFYDLLARFLYSHFSSYFFPKVPQGAEKRTARTLLIYIEEFSDLYLVVLTTLRAAGFMRGIICYVCPSKRFNVYMQEWHTGCLEIIFYCFERGRGAATNVPNKG